MAISESQLETWAHQGSVTQSANTYATIRRALESNDATYTSRDFAVFLQGSYGNDTNIYAESDVDVVICLDATFYYSLDDLTPSERAAFEAAYSGGATYTHAQFKAHVLNALQDCFPGAITPGNKAIKITDGSNRRNADVVAAAQFRRYRRFVTPSNATYDTGLCLFDAAGNRIVNYPRQYSENCTAKHQGTNGWFKPTVRILKNIRGALVDEGVVNKKIAPSYFLEGLLYNVPNEHFGGSYENTMVASINWILGADRSQFVCPNDQYYLLRDSAETWLPANCDRFLNALVQYWKDWS